MNGRSLFYISVALLFLGFFYLLIGIRAPVDIYDEGVAVYGAERVMHGEIPYRDFWTIYSPGQFYVLAGIFKLFGTSIWAERLWDALGRSLLSLMVFLIAIRLASVRVALFVWLVLTLWLGSLGYFGYPTFPAMLFSMFSLICFLFFFFGQKRFVLFWGGLMAGVATLFRQDTGFFLLVAEVLTIMLFIFFHRRQGRKDLPHLRPNPLRPLILYAFGSGIVLVPVFIYFLSVVGTDDLLHQLIVFPLKIFPAVRSLPYPAPLPDLAPLLRGEASLGAFLGSTVDRIPFYFTLTTLVAIAIRLFLRFRRKSPDRRLESAYDPNLWGTALLALFGLLSFNHVRVRSDNIHLIMPFTVALLLFSIGVANVLSGKKRSRRSIVRGALILAVLLMIRPLDKLINTLVQSEKLQSLTKHNLPRAGGIAVDSSQAGAAEFVRQNLSPGEPIFVGSYRHDRLYTSDVMFYFLSEHPSATKYHELSPGSATTWPVQNEIVKDLRRHDVRYIVLLARIDIAGRTNERQPVLLLDNFLKRNYRILRVFGGYAVLARQSDHFL